MLTNGEAVFASSPASASSSLHDTAEDQLLAVVMAVMLLTTMVNFSSCLNPLKRMLMAVVATMHTVSLVRLFHVHSRKNQCPFRMKQYAVLG